MMPRLSKESQEPGHDPDTKVQDLEDSSTSATLAFDSFESGLARAKMIHGLPWTRTHQNRPDTVH